MRGLIRKVLSLALAAALLAPVAADAITPQQRAILATKPKAIASWSASTSPSVPTSYVTVGRSSTGGYFNSSGVLSSAATNTGRIDYDPSTLAIRGLLLETSFAELLLQTNFAASWTTSRGTITAGAATGIDGSASAATFVEDTTASNTHVTSRSITFASGSTYIISIVAKPKGRSWLGLRLPAAAFTSTLTASCDFTNGVVGTVSGGMTAGIQSLGNGWYRCWATAAATASASGSVQILIGSADNTFSYTGDGSSGLYVTYAQIGVATFPTSPVAATTVAVTRAADVPAAASLTGNPAIIQYRDQATGARARKVLSAWSSISGETSKWIEAFKIYPTGTPLSFLNSRLVVDGQW